MAGKRHDLEVVVTTREEMEAGLKRAEDKVRQFGANVDNALSAVAWGAVTRKIVAMGDAAVDAFAEQQRAMSGLTAIAKAYGQEQLAVEQATKTLTASGILPLTTAAGALRDLLSTGLSLDQAVTMVQTFSDRAAIGRSSTLTMAQAVENLARAFKTGQSELGDMSGLTDNWATDIIPRGAAAMGKQVAQLTAAEVAQAKYLGVLQVSQPYLGAATSMTEDLAGKQATLETTLQRTTAVIGGALAPAAEGYTEAATSAAEAVQRWVAANEEATRGITLIGGGAAGAVAGVGALAGAVRVLAAALGGGWIGIAATALIGLGGALAGAWANQRAAAIEQEKHEQSAIGLAEQYERLNRTLADGQATTAEKQRAERELKTIISQLGELMPEMVSQWDAEGKAIALNTEKVKANTAAYKENAKQRAEQGLDAAREAAQKAWARVNSLEQSWGLAPGVKAERRSELDALVGDGRMSQAEADAQYATFTATIDTQLAKLGEAKVEAQRLQAEFVRLLTMAVGGAQNIESWDFDPNALGKGGAGSGSGSPGTPGKDDPVRTALRALEHRRSMDEVDAPGYIAGLEEIKRAYQVTGEQLMDIDERIYRTRAQMTEQEKQDAEAARKAKLDAAVRMLDFQRNIGAASTQDEVNRLSEILSTYELTNEERMALLERYYGARERLNQDAQRKEQDAARAAAQTEEERVRAAVVSINHRAQIGEMTRAEEIAALEAHLTEEADYYSRHVDDRWAIEERLYALRERARQEDLQAEETAARQAAQARVDAERRAASAISSLRAVLRQAQEDDLADLRAEQQAEESALQRRIDQLRKQLEVQEKANREEERQLKLEEIRRRLADAQNGPLEEFITATGERIWRNRQAEEIERELAEETARQEEERAREAIQAEIDRLQERLSRMQSAHQEELAERQSFWQALLGMDDKELAELVAQTDTAMGEDGWYGAVQRWLETAAKTANEKVGNITTDLQRIVTEVQAAQRALDSLPAGDGTGEQTQSIPPPATIPAGAMGGMNVGGITIPITVTGASDPVATATAVRGAVQQGVADGLDMAALRRGARYGARTI